MECSHEAAKPVAKRRVPPPRLLHRIQLHRHELLRVRVLPRGALGVHLVLENHSCPHAARVPATAKGKGGKTLISKNGASRSGPVCSGSECDVVMHLTDMHCEHLTCSAGDFLLFRCEACSRMLCVEHRAAMLYMLMNNRAGELDQSSLDWPICGRSVTFNRARGGDDAKVFWEQH
jgi:hypothetical protein